MTNPPAVELRNLSVTFPEAPSNVLEDVTLTLAPGETVLIIGPSGCGKSTLTLTLNGIVPHSIPARVGGSATIYGTSVAGRPVATFAGEIAYVFQDADSQFCTHTVEDEIAFALENLCIPRDDIERGIVRAMALAGLAPTLRKRALATLSGGEKQKVTLAAALAQPAKVFVFDEATASFDPASVRAFTRTIGDLRRERPEAAILLVAHDFDRLIPLVDRVIVLGASGRIMAEGAPADVLYNYAGTLTSLGLHFPAAITLARELDAGGPGHAGRPLTMGELLASLRPSTNAKRRVDEFLARLRTTDRTDDAAPLIRLESVDYATRDGAKLLSGVSLELRRGEVVALVGGNGAGKSTLAGLVAGILAPTAGTCSRLDGRDDIGFVFQNPEHQFLGQSVLEEILISFVPDARARRRLAGAERAALDRRAAELLEKFSLAGLDDRHPFDLSQGEKRRLSILVALARIEPALLILDEPTHGLDAANVERVVQLIAKLRSPERCIVLISHDMDLVWRTADRMAVMAAGRILAMGSVDAIFSQPLMLAEAGLELPSFHPDELKRRVSCAAA